MEISLKLFCLFAYRGSFYFIILFNVGGPPPPVLKLKIGILLGIFAKAGLFLRNLDITLAEGRTSSCKLEVEKGRFLCIKRQKKSSKGIPLILFLFLLYWSSMKSFSYVTAFHFLFLEMNVTKNTRYH